jgi:hypothetical protein
MPAHLTWLRCAGLALCALAISRTAAIAADSTFVVQGSGPQAPRQPQLAIDHEGTIHLTYGAGNSVFYCRSADLGKSFSKGVELPSCGVISLGMRRGPRIAVTKKAICIAVIGGKQGKGKDGDVWAIRSPDGGKTWSEPVRVNDVESAAREGLHAMADGPNDALCCTWLDLRNKRSEVMAATSSDGGKSWGKNVLVYRSPDGNVCECCHPSVAYSPKGELHVMWRNSLGGNRDMYLATSKDGGQTFAAAKKLGSVSWKLNACPMDGGGLAVAASGVATVWRREGEIYVTSSEEPSGKRTGEGRQPWLAATDKGSFAVWLAEKSSDLMLLEPGARRAVALGTKAADPVIATNGETGGPVVVAWESRESGHGTIFCRVIVEGRSR